MRSIMKASIVRPDCGTVLWRTPSSITWMPASVDENPRASIPGIQPVSAHVTIGSAGGGRVEPHRFFIRPAFNVHLQLHNRLLHHDRNADRGALYHNRS